MSDLKASLGGLPRPSEAAEIWHSIGLEEAHHSTALEGNTLVLNQVRELLEHGRAVGAKELREYLEVTGYNKAASWIYEHAIDHKDDPNQLLTLSEIRYTHQLAVEDEWRYLERRENPGEWRDADIAPFASGMQPPHAWMVSSEMDTFVRTVGKGPDNSVHPILWLAEIHARFERIHPFRDGNGRTGRLITNLLLVRLGYAPAIIAKGVRSAYLSALARADTGDPRPLADLFARAVKGNLDRFVYPAIAGPVKLVPLTALATRERPLQALRAAAQRGRLRHRLQNGILHSSKAWVDEYFKSKDPRGRKVAS